MKTSTVLTLVGLLWVVPSFADEPDEGRRTLRPADYGRWESLGFRNILSPDGRWLAYSIRRVNGERQLCLRMLATDSTKDFAFGSNPVFSKDGKWLAFGIGVSDEEREKLTKASKPVRQKLGLHDLVTGETTEIESVASYSFSENGHYLVMRRYPLKGKKSRGVDVVVRDLSTRLDTNFGNVASFSWADERTLLAMSIDAEGGAGNGVRIFDPATSVLRTLHSSERSYKNLTWREDHADLAVFQETEHEKDEEPTHVVHTWRGLDSDSSRHRAYDPLKDESFPENMRVVEFAGLRWSEDGKGVFFGVRDWEKKPKALQPDEPSLEEVTAEKDSREKEPERKAKVAIYSPDDPPATDDEKDPAKKKKSKSLRETLEDPAGVEVWHAQDIDIIPLQKKTAGRDRRRSFLSVWWIEDDHFVQLADEVMKSIALLEGHQHGVGSDNSPYETERRFGPTLMDCYVVDTHNGSRRKFLDRNKYRFTSSPDGSTCLYVRDDQVWSYHIESGRHRNLTEDLPTSFINFEGGVLTDENRPYGIGGWTEDGEQVLLYDRFDMWLVSTDGSGGKRLTRGADDQIRHRRQVVDRETEETIDLDRPMFVSLYGERTKKTGYARLRIGEAPERLVWKDCSIGRLMKAEQAEVYAFVEQSFHDSPDIFVGDAELVSARQVTRTNPFQEDFLWGRSELIDYESDNGVALQGALCYPASYVEGRQYPMIVDIYERRSQGLHRYSSPSERSAYNSTVFTQEGYFVYLPDIAYRPQNPGLSAVECVVPAVKAAIATGNIDPERIGLVGHSWGAYQTAFIVTQTDLFAAGIAGAPLTNMMSMSMSIYWNSGQADAWIFHESQGRMDRPFWQDVDTYIKNSPIFSIDNLNTPLLIAFGDEDGAVDFNQGVEMYNAARLAGKQLVMLVYPGENHGLGKKPNQVDYHYRILEWFGHYLKSDEAPPWIEEGQSFIDREKEIEKQKKSKGSGGRGSGRPGPGPRRR